MKKGREGKEGRGERVVVQFRNGWVKGVRCGE